MFDSKLYLFIIKKSSLSVQITQAEEIEKQLQIEINKKKHAYKEISTNLKSVFDVRILSLNKSK